jgi:hypothetical protein
MLDRLIQALSDLPDLEGHERLAFVELLFAARADQNRAPLRHVPRAPENEYEERLLASAIELEACRAARLRAIDAGIAAFCGRALRNGLAATIRSLSVEGPVIDALVLQPAGTGRFRLSGGHKAQRHLEACRHRAATDLLTLHTARAASATFEFAAMPCPSRSVSLRIAHGIGIDRQGGIWRTGAPGQERGLPQPVPVQALFTATCRFDRAFDWHLLAHAHSLVRAALATAELARLQPLARDNAQFIELMTAAFVEEGIAAPLPIMLALHRRRVEFEAALSVAVERGRLAVLLDVLIGLAFDAIGIGDRIIDAVAPALSTVMAALLADDTDSLEAVAETYAVFGTLLLEQDGVTAPPEHAHRALEAARDRGLMNPIVVGEAIVWSAGAVRQALPRA